jgi:ATP-dependent RNA helicase DDX46/PRP5
MSRQYYNKNSGYHRNGYNQYPPQSQYQSQNQQYPQQYYDNNHNYHQHNQYYDQYNYASGQYNQQSHHYSTRNLYGSHYDRSQNSQMNANYNSQKYYPNENVSINNMKSSKVTNEPSKSSFLQTQTDQTKVENENKNENENELVKKEVESKQINENINGKLNEIGNVKNEIEKLDSVNNIDNIEERKEKLIQWKNKKVLKGGIKKKSLMEFSKKKNNNSKIITKMLLKQPAFDFDNFDTETKVKADEEKPTLHIKNAEYMEIYEEENGKKESDNDNLEKEEEKEEEYQHDSDDDKDDLDDLDVFLSTLQNKKTNHSKNLNIINENTEDLLDNESNTVHINDEAEKLIKILNEKNKKDLPVHEFSTLPFTKTFYKECDFIKRLSNDDVKELRKHDSVKIQGKAILKPILEWSQLGFPASIFEVLKALNFTSPTPIQCEGLPHIMNGNDFIGIAKTGSGKTIAFLLPLFRQLLSNPIPPLSATGGSTPRAIILTPTRELALQIAKTAKAFADKLGLKICKCYGGQSISKQISDLKKQADIIIGTPGRIIDLLCTNGGRILNLSYITYLVMDEADRMFDLGFEPQIFKILNVIRPDKQAVLFSATFPPKMQNLARKTLNNPIEVLIGNKNIVNENINQHFEIVPDEESKFNKLLNILGNNYNEKNGKVLIFIEKQTGCDSMVKKLIKRGYPVMSLHGGKDQSERDGAIKDFQNGIIDIIVATSIASRGLDVDNLNLVINYDAPSHLEDYVHRVGRTGRGTNKGDAYTILTKDQEKCAFDLVKVLKAGINDNSDNTGKQEIPAELLEMATKFEAKLKEGDVKFGSGFSGKGLEKLQAIRERNENLEKQVYLKEDINIDDAQPKDHGGINIGDASVEPSKKSDLLKNFSVKYFTSKGTFGAKIGINDLPQSTRWFITTRESYNRVSELTGVSVTTRGRYYPPGQTPASNEDACLYILVEGPNNQSVSQAVQLFAESVVRGLERETTNSGKYSIV